MPQISILEGLRGASVSESVLSASEQIKSIWDLGGLTWRRLLSRAWNGVLQNDLLNRAYELAYNFLLAVFPMLLFVLALLGAFASAGKLRGDLFFYLQQLLPPAGYNVIVSTIREVTKNSSSGKLTFGLLFALYAGSGGMTELISTLNAAYEVHEGRSWSVVRLVAIGLTIAMSIHIILALLLVLGGGSVLQHLGGVLGLSALVLTAGKILQWTLALTFVVIAFAVIYILCTRRERTALVLDYSRIGDRRWAMDSRIGRPASVPALLQYLQQNLWIARRGHDSDALVQCDRPPVPRGRASEFHH